MTTDTKYGFRAELQISYDDAIERVTAALQSEGFGVLTRIDIQATLKKKIDADFRRYIILGACNPTLANTALNTELEIGLLLPCNIIVYERDGGGSVVSIADPEIMMQAAANEALAPLGGDAAARLRRVLDSL